MGNIKVKDEDGKWRVVATSKASDISIEDASVFNTEAPSVETAIVDHEKRVQELEKNVRWLALHGGGGSGGGGGTGGVTEATAKILVNNVESGNTVTINGTSITIYFDGLKASLKKAWDVTISIGGNVVKKGNIKYTSNSITVSYNELSSKLSNNKGTLTVSAIYEDEQNGVYGNEMWNGSIVDAAVFLSMEDTVIKLTDLQESSIIVNYNIGLTGKYKVSFLIYNQDNPEVYSEESEVNLTNNKGSQSIFTENININKADSFKIKITFTSLDNADITNTIYGNLTITSNNITVLNKNDNSIDVTNPTVVSLSGSLIFSWQAFLSTVNGFYYAYKVNNTVIYENENGIFGNVITDTITLSRKSFAKEGDLVVTLYIKSNDNKEYSQNYYFNLSASISELLSERDAIKYNNIVEFYAKDYDSSVITLNSVKENYVYNGLESVAKCNLNAYNVNNIIGIQRPSNNVPYYRFSNGSFGAINNINIKTKNKELSLTPDKIFTDSYVINICFKCDYHPDDDRTIFNWGKVNSLGNTITGIEIKDHSIIVNNEEVFTIEDNTIYDITIVIKNIEKNYSSTQQESVKYCGIYINGVLSVLRVNLPKDFELNDTIYFGGKAITFDKDNTEIINLCDFNLYRFSLYTTEFDELDILTNEINNKVITSWKNNTFDFDIINTELAKNGSSNNNGLIYSSLYNNGQYDINFLIQNTGLSINNDIAENFVNYLQIPIMYIDVSTGWTFAAFTSAQTKSTKLSSVDKVTIQYLDVHNSNSSVISITNVKIDVQGTSTLGDNIKNLNITLPDNSLFIPKETWLPEQTYTLKADVVDSSHSNNASIGKFINEVLADPVEGFMEIDKTAKSNINDSYYVKNQQIGPNNEQLVHPKVTVEGFPVFLIMRFAENGNDPIVAPVGIYSFNLGRDAVRNLGYSKLDKVLINNQEIKINTFPFSSNENVIYQNETKNVKDTWIEVDDNLSINGIDKLEPNGIIPEDIDSSGSAFWQTDKTIINKIFESKYSVNVGNERSIQNPAEDPKFVEFVKMIAMLPVEGLWQYPSIVSGSYYPDNTTGSYNKYKYDGKNFVLTDNKERISVAENDYSVTEMPFNYVEFCKYFVIANMLGLYDNLAKNMVLRKYGDGIYYPGFYDLDSTLGQDNQSLLNITTSLWIKNIKNYKEDGATNELFCEFYKSSVNGTKVEGDLNNSVFSGSHSKLWLSLDTPFVRNILYSNVSGYGTSVYSYYWSQLRNFLDNKAKKNGYDNIVDFFIEEYYLKQTGDCGSLIFNLDYRCKYLFQYDAVEDYNVLGSVNKLHGRKESYTRQWLKNHIIFLDSLFYSRNLNMSLTAKNNLFNQITITSMYSDGVMPITTNKDIILKYNYQNLSNSFIVCPKNKTVYVSVGNNTSGGSMNMYLYNSSEIIGLDDDNIKLSKLGIANFVNGNPNTNPIDIDKFAAITELNLKDSDKLETLNLDIFKTLNDTSELRVLNLNNTNGKSISLNLTSYVDGEEVTKFIKLREIDISNSKIVSQLSIPNIPLKVLKLDNSAITAINLNKQHYISNLNTTGCQKLITYNINECSKFETLNISSLNSLTTLSITNNVNLKSIVINNCNELVNINIENNKNLTSIKINNCSKLTGANSSHFAIAGNTSLLTLDVSSNSNLQTFTITNSNQNNITTLDLHSTKVKYITNDDLTYDTLEEDSTGLLNLINFKKANIIIYSNDAVRFIQYNNDINNLVSIKNRFVNCKNLKCIFGAVSIDCSYCFKDCTDYNILWPNQNYTNTYNFDITIPSSHNLKVNSYTSSIYMIINNGYYTFENTSINERDVVYACISIGISNATINCTRTFWGKNKLFPVNGWPKGFPLNIFRNWNNVTNIYECFNTYDIILRPGIFKDLTKCTDITRFSSNTIIFSIDTFKTLLGYSPIVNFSWQSCICLPNNTDEITWLNTNYNNTISAHPNDVGDFTNFNKVFRNLQSISHVNFANRIKYSTLKLPTSIRSVHYSFGSNNSYDETLHFNELFENDKNNNITSVVASFITSGTVPTLIIDENTFANTPNLIEFGITYSDNALSLYDTYTCQGWNKVCNDYTFPYGIIKNKNMTNVSALFRGMKAPNLTGTVSFPNNIFNGCTKLVSIVGIMQDVQFNYKLTSNGFKDCTNLSRVARAFYSSIGSSTSNLSKLSGCIPTRLFYHGGNSGTKNIVGLNKSDLDSSKTFPDEEDITKNKSQSINTFAPNRKIIDMYQCFYGCVYLNNFTRTSEETTSFRNEPNNDYSPFDYIYNNSSKKYSVATDKRKYDCSWAYTGNPEDMQNTDIYKYMDDEIVTSVNGSINYMCAPDLLRYCADNCNINNLFEHCGMYTGITNNSNYVIGTSWDDIGITGRIVPYLLNNLKLCTSIQSMFAGCRRISTYKDKNGSIYKIPPKFFDNNTNIVNLNNTFAYNDFEQFTNLSVFNKLTQPLQILNTFMYCRFKNNETPSANFNLSNVFNSNKIKFAGGTFSAYTINYSIDSNGNLQWDNFSIAYPSNQLAVPYSITIDNNFNTNQSSVLSKAMYMYYGRGTNNGTDSVISNNRRNY